MLTICEGLDRTGKTTVAGYFESIGYKVIHMSAPPKGQHADNFLQEMLDIVQSATLNDIFLDRSYYGEACIWPKIYGRTALIDKDGLEILREMENQVGTKRILMTAGNTPEQIAAHWERCVANKEPITKKQFGEARNLYSLMAREYDFEVITLPAFCKEFNLDYEAVIATPSQTKPVSQSETPSDTPKQIGSAQSPAPSRTIDQRALLEKANAINDVLALSRILKNKGPLYDELESDIRTFLNGKLAAVFGQPEEKLGLSPEEIVFFKAMYKRVIEKEN